MRRVCRSVGRADLRDAPVRGRRSVWEEGCCGAESVRERRPHLITASQAQLVRYTLGSYTIPVVSTRARLDTNVAFAISAVLIFGAFVVWLVAPPCEGSFKISFSPKDFGFECQLPPIPDKQRVEIRGRVRDHESADRDVANGESSRRVVPCTKVRGSRTFRRAIKDAEIADSICRELVAAVPRNWKSEPQFYRVQDDGSVSFNTGSRHQEVEVWCNCHPVENDQSTLTAAAAAPHPAPTAKSCAFSWGRTDHPHGDCNEQPCQGRIPVKRCHGVPPGVDVVISFDGTIDLGGSCSEGGGSQRWGLRDSISGNETSEVLERSGCAGYGIVDRGGGRVQKCTLDLRGKASGPDHEIPGTVRAQPQLRECSCGNGSHCRLGGTLTITELQTTAQ